MAQRTRSWQGSAGSGNNLSLAIFFRVVQTPIGTSSTDFRGLQSSTPGFILRGVGYFWRTCCPAILAGACVPATGPAQQMGFPEDALLAHRIAGSDTVAVSAGTQLPFMPTDIDIEISTTGDVVAARLADTHDLIRDTGPALAAAKRWKFRPFTYRGKPVVATGSVRINYRSPGVWADRSRPMPPIDYAKLRISLSRSACYGSCPDYRVTIAGDGTVTFDTRVPPVTPVAGVHRAYSRSDGVLIGGHHVGHVDRAVIDALLARFRAAHFFGLKDQYAAAVTDNPTYVVTLSSGDASKQVLDYVGEEAGMPPVEADIEKAIDVAADTARWVTGDEHTVAALQAEGFDARSEDAVRLADFAVTNDATPDRVLIDLIDAGLPLGRPYRAARAERMLFGSYLAVQAARFGRAQLLDGLDAGGWLKKAPTASLTDAFVAGGAGCNASIAAKLIKAGVDPNARSSIPKQELMGIDSGRRTALMVAEGSMGPCWEASTSALVDLARALTAAGVDINARDSEGQTVIFGVEKIEILDALLAAGARANVRDAHGRSAVFYSWTDAIVIRLLDAGADPHGTDDSGKTLRQLAAEHGMPTTRAWLDAHHIA